MRVLFTTTPDKSLFQQMVPLAWALRTAGHEVRVACQPSFADTVPQAGLTAVPVGNERSVWRLPQLTPEHTEAERDGLGFPYNAAERAPEDLDWTTMLEGYQRVVGRWHKSDNFPVTADLVAFSRAWQPDLILWEPLCYAGAIAAKACGAAHARLLWSIDVLGLTRARFLDLKRQQPQSEQADPLADWLGGYARKYGGEFSEDMTTGQFSIDQFPSSLRMTAPGHRYIPMRYVPYGGPVSVPAWLREPPTKPRVALTLGIAATNRFAGHVANVPDILDSLADLDIEVVATLAQPEQDKLTRIPDNVRVVSYVPLHALVQTCDAVINHAGPGTFLTTAISAVPQVAVPWDFDEPELARRAAAQGSVVALRADRATGEAVREALLKVLCEPGYRTAAAQLGAQFHALPTPNELVVRLEELTEKYRTPESAGFPSSVGADLLSLAGAGLPSGAGLPESEAAGFAEAEGADFVPAAGVGS
ncbi:activator-dependent family glycosyltransferase [Streptomyces lunaelactis]|uniref:activator-dependent family glycosyltransferase n=1 Tax=Streptomyces lunaelactis TaxID=1535768 RepID=UPI0015845C93|nr:activator-dependent family glycosyltransferase [Streptomyces lunaelactis]NUK17888.1 activator-dependent family glycosyltransferase [Streptomyces lunaelactis]